MNHLIKGAIHSFYYHQDENDSYYACRTGLNTHYYHYNKSTGNLYETDDFNILDEVINTLQATELTENVFSLQKFVLDEEILSFLNSLDYKTSKKDYGYDEATRIFSTSYNLMS